MEEQEALSVLGLRGPVDAAEVKRAYRRLARTQHPDVGGDAAAFQRIQLAYEVVAQGSHLRTGPAPQQRVASVDDRWWDGGSPWHEDPVDAGDVDLDRAPADDAATAMDVDLLAALLVGRTPVAPLVLHSRAPGSRLHRVISWLQPDLLATTSIAAATDGRHAGHDVEVVVSSAGGRGRRLLASCQSPSGWTLARGSETARLRRSMHPSRVQTDTAVRVARELDAALTHLGWPLGEWYRLPPT